MVSSYKFFATAVALGFTLGAAQAADVRRAYPVRPLPPPMMQAPPLLVDEYASGWYLRGDIGYRMNKVDSVSNAGARAVVKSDLGNSWIAGVGAGYKWQWLRADATIDYGIKAKYSGDTASKQDDFTAKIDSIAVLAHAYGALDTWWALTPYVGAGVGTARVSTSDFRQHFLAAVPAASTNTQWNLAWALMAGVSYRVSGNYSIDLGYRHINLGDAQTGRDAYGNQLTFKKLSGDEIRLGVRYMID